MRLRQGSEFVASNRAARAGATVAIRPLGGRDDSALEVDLPVGAEAEYGWADPFRDARRTVDVVVNGKACRVMDARRTVRRVIASESVAISVTRPCGGQLRRVRASACPRCAHQTKAGRLSALARKRAV